MEPGNLFDTDDDPISQDFEFTKANGWTDEVYAAKRANLAAVLNQLHGGNGPELLGVAEVEGDDVFTQLLEDTGNPHLKVATDPNPPTALRIVAARPDHGTQIVTASPRSRPLVGVSHARGLPLCRCARSRRSFHRSGSPGVACCPACQAHV